MKRTILSSLLMLLMFGAASAQNNKTELKTEIDTISYEIGVANSNGLRNYLINQLGVDTTYIDEFYKGIVATVNASKDKKLAAYFAGIQIGQQINSSICESANRELFGSDTAHTINRDLLIAGVIDGDKGSTAISKDVIMAEVEEKVAAYKAKFLTENYSANKKNSEDFIAQKAKEEGVQKLPGGTLYKVLKEGTGEKPSIDNYVSVIYEGRLADGTVFDSSNGLPIDIAIKQLIPSWQEALPAMAEGSEWELYIPYDQAYGEHEMGMIKPYSALAFTITLVKAQVTPPAPPQTFSPKQK